MRLINNNFLDVVYPACSHSVTVGLPASFLSKPHEQEVNINNVTTVSGPDLVCLWSLRATGISAFCILFSAHVALHRKATSITRFSLSGAPFRGKIGFV